MKKTILFITSAILLASVIFIFAGNQDIIGPVQPACCASEDGFCRDIGKPVGQAGCGLEHEKWTFISDEDFCNQFDECYAGECSIRGHALPGDREYYECVATCKDTGECKCTGDLKTCLGEFSWIVLPRTY
ncbi:MAG: hypothetical protein ABIJ34_00525 [archaeon]